MVPHQKYDMKHDLAPTHSIETTGHSCVAQNDLSSIPTFSKLRFEISYSPEGAGVAAVCVSALQGARRQQIWLDTAVLGGSL